MSKPITWPRWVYGPGGMDDGKIITCEEERPDGYLDHWEDHDAAPEQTDEQKQAAKELADAKADAKAAEKEYRRELREYLDLHGVDYAKNLSTSKLVDLKVALDEHLSKVDPPDDAE